MKGKEEKTSNTRGERHSILNRYHDVSVEDITMKYWIQLGRETWETSGFLAYFLGAEIPAEVKAGAGSSRPALPLPFPVEASKRSLEEPVKPRTSVSRAVVASVLVFCSEEQN